MSANNPYQTYQQNSAQTASPGQLTLMLYNGCLKFIKQAKVAIEENNIEARNTNIIKAQNIIREFMVTLNMDLEVSKSMMQMYDYMLQKLIEANMKSDLEALAEVEAYVIEFRDTWKQVLQVNRQAQFGKSPQNEHVSTSS